MENKDVRNRIAGTIIRVMRPSDGHSVKLLVHYAHEDETTVLTEPEIETLIEALELKKKTGLKIEKDGIC